MNVILGVTGGSGCGKSAFCRELSRLGAYVIDADVVARQIVEKGMPALMEIKEEFGEEYLLPDGTLNRKKLGEFVFFNPLKLEKLNEITHKYITEEINKKLKEKEYGLRIIDAALLFESGLDKICDHTASVLASRDVRAARIMERDDISQIAAYSRIDAQQNDEFYKKRADDVIENDGAEAELIAKAQKYWSKLETEF